MVKFEKSKVGSNNPEWSGSKKSGLLRIEQSGEVRFEQSEVVRVQKQSEVIRFEQSRVVGLGFEHPEDVHTFLIDNQGRTTRSSRSAGPQPVPSPSTSPLS